MNRGGRPLVTVGGVGKGAMTVRSPLLLLLAVVLCAAALGPALTCDHPPQVRTVAAVAPADAPADAAEVAHAGSAVPDPCTAQRPCQHDPGDGRDGGPAVVRALDPPRDAGPALAPLCALPRPGGAAAALPAPAPAVAASAPLDLLCVDRN